ncbi:MAG: hypothetical protein ABI972_15210 [Acidobacteriota bacterium]
MKRRAVLGWFGGLFGAAAFASEPKGVEGVLRVPAVLETDSGKLRLEGDKQTTAVLGDQRLDGMRVRLMGERAGVDLFRVGPIHTRALRVVQGAKLMFVTYWCAVCSIRTYAPGPCMCCQEETALDLRETVS